MSRILDLLGGAWMVLFHGFIPVSRIQMAEYSDMRHNWPRLQREAAQWRTHQARQDAVNSLSSTYGERTLALVCKLEAAEAEILRLRKRNGQLVEQVSSSIPTASTLTNEGQQS